MWLLPGETRHFEGTGHRDNDPIPLLLRLNLARYEGEAQNAKLYAPAHTLVGLLAASPRGQRQHETALKEGTTCIACHYNLVHEEVEPSEAILNAIGDQ